MAERVKHKESQSNTAFCLVILQTFVSSVGKRHYHQRERHRCDEDDHNTKQDMRRVSVWGEIAGKQGCVKPHYKLEAWVELQVYFAIVYLALMATSKQMFKCLTYTCRLKS